MYKIFYLSSEGVANEGFVRSVVKMGIMLHFEGPKGENWFNFNLVPLSSTFTWSDMRWLIAVTLEKLTCGSHDNWI